MEIMRWPCRDMNISSCTVNAFNKFSDSVENDFPQINGDLLVSCFCSNVFSLMQWCCFCVHVRGNVSPKLSKSLTTLLLLRFLVYLELSYRRVLVWENAPGNTWISRVRSCEHQNLHTLKWCRMMFIFGFLWRPKSISLELAWFLHIFHIRFRMFKNIW